MGRFALAAAVVLGFAITAALCNLFVPLRQVLERREQQKQQAAPQPARPAVPEPAPLRAPLWGGLCMAVGTVAAVGVGWLAACIGQPELLGSEGQLMARLLTALAGALGFGVVGLAEDLARMRSPAALGLRRGTRLLLEALAAAAVALMLRAVGCLPRGLGVPGVGYVLLGRAAPLLWAALMVALAECARVAEQTEGSVCGAAFVAMLALIMVEAGLGAGALAVLPAALAGALVALLLWAFPPAKLGAGCCGSLFAAGAIGCIPLCLDLTSLTVPLALPFWAEGILLALQLLHAKRTGKPLRCWVQKHKLSPEGAFLCSFVLSACGYVLALALLRWC